MSHTNATNTQRAILDLLGEDFRRDLYEGASASGKSGSGFFWVTYTFGKVYSPLSHREVIDLLDRGLIVEKWPGCYTTPENLSAQAGTGQRTTKPTLTVEASPALSKGGA